MQRVIQPVARPIDLGKPVLPVAILLAFASLVALAVLASAQNPLDLDVKIAGWVQGLEFPGLHAATRAVNIITGAPMAISLWFVTMAFFVLKGRPVEAVAVFMICGLWIANDFVGIVVQRPSPSAELNGVVEFTRTASGSFPSGHAVGAVAYYGLITFITLSSVKCGHLRFTFPAFALAIIVLTPIARIYAGAHWPTDVLGSYLIGFMGVAGIAWFYTNVKLDTLHIPRPRGKKPETMVTDGFTVAGSIAGKVYLDWKAGTATKEYNPPLPVRALYWIAFQAPFPYQVRKDSLEAAAAKRKIVGLLTKHRFGYDMMAAVHRIEKSENGYRFVTELIQGVEPESNGEVEDLLNEMYSSFQEAGMPTWQIAPGNPHAYSNFIRRPNGELKLIDLESALVSTSYPWKELRAALRDGNFPTFDDVDFVQLRADVSAQAGQLTDPLGMEGLQELNQSIDAAESVSRSWKDSEPRIWGRLAARVYRLLDFSGPIAGIRRRLDGA